MKWFAVTVIPAIITVSGCASGWLDVPRADNHPESSQLKAFAAHHWDVLANDVAAQIRTALYRTDYSDQPLALAPPREKTAFAHAFNNFLTSHLVQSGMNVSIKPENLMVHVDVQVIHHQSQVNNRFNYYPLTLLTSGLLVARGLEIINETHPSGDFGFAASATALGAAAGVDFARLQTEGRAYGGPSRTEVVVTTALLNKDRFVAQLSDIYYIDGVDDVLYANYQSGTPVKEWQLVQPKTP